MRAARHSAILLTGVLCLLLTAAQRQPYVTADQFDFQSLIGSPPADNSQEHRAEVRHMLELQAARTPAEVKRCQQEMGVNVYTFASILGPWFNPHDLPQTAKLFREVSNEGTIVADSPKKHWARVRPPVANPEIHPCVHLETSGSFPSGHATRAMLWATLLADMFPEHAKEILARGRQIGDDRVLAGMHYPSDVAAGDKLGVAMAKKMLANPAFDADFEKAKQECRAEEHAAAAHR